jgi:hypothetical protein
MKRYFIMFTVIVMALCVGFSSCSDDENGNDSIVGDDSIVNVWTFVNMTADIQNPTDPDAAEYEKAKLGFAFVFWQGATLEFKSDRTFVFNIFGESYRGSYSINGDRLSVDLDDEWDFVDGETEDVSLEDISNSGAITVKDGVLTITSFTEDNLDIEDEEGITRRELGFTKYEVKMTFRRYVTK